MHESICIVELNDAHNSEQWSEQLGGNHTACAVLGATLKGLGIASEVLATVGIALLMAAGATIAAFSGE